MTQAYDAALAYLFGRLNYERAGLPRNPSELRLGRMRRLLRRLGDPQDALRIVHVTGTKGKGSTSAMVASALSASGVRTGLFCSPHLHRLEERFAVDGREPTAAEMVALVEAVRPAVELVDATDPHPRRRDLTFFEVTTAMGLLHFARRACGAVVLEVGLGGRLDSTNVVRPLASVITSISFDHTRQLGGTLGAIAAEKAGIIKRGGEVVVGVRAEEPLAAIERVARQRRARVRRVGRDYEGRHEPPSPVDRPEAGRVAARTWRRAWGPLPLPLLGPHQAENAATALATLDVLADRGLEVGPGAVAAGFASLRFPARVEVLGGRPLVVVDGAHNAASAEALAATLRACFPPSRRTLVFGTTRDKDLAAQLRALLPLFDAVVVTQYVENPRALPPAEVADAVAAIRGAPPEVAAEPASALELARRRTAPDGLICVTGSLFLAAEARAVLLGRAPLAVAGAATV
jgi:dihydrofolate synthase/folylpolyglutamate synthase